MDSAELLDFCRSGLARFKCPKYITFVDDYPKTVTGKIKKFELKNDCTKTFPELLKEI